MGCLVGHFLPTTVRGRNLKPTMGRLHTEQAPCCRFNARSSGFSTDRLRGMLGGCSFSHLGLGVCAPSPLLWSPLWLDMAMSIADCSPPGTHGHTWVSRNRSSSTEAVADCSFTIISPSNRRIPAQHEALLKKKKRPQMWLLTD